MCRLLCRRDAAATSPALFHLARKETAVFPGDRATLRGKTVKLYSVQPAQSPALETRPRDKRDFAKELLLRAFAATVLARLLLRRRGVIFDSADGGQASATLASRKLRHEGKIPDPAFWESCSLDPPETFALSAKNVGGFPLSPPETFPSIQTHIPYVDME